MQFVVKYVVVKEEEEKVFFKKWQRAILVPKSLLASYGFRVLAKKKRLKNVATFCFEPLELSVQTPLPSSFTLFSLPKLFQPKHIKPPAAT